MRSRRSLKPAPTSDLDVAGLASASGRVEMWAEAINRADARRVAEIGVWKGEFARQLLERCPGIEAYVMIDPWANLPDWNKPLNVDQARFDDVHDEAMAKTDFAKARRVVLRGRTKDVADEIGDGSLDFAYIDGDHTLRGISIDLMKILPKVREGGFIGGDDFSASPWQHDARFEPTLVFPFAIFFAEAMNLPVAALPHDQFLIRNAPDEGFSFTDLTGKYADLSLNELSPSHVVSRLVDKAGRKLGLRH